MMIVIEFYFNNMINHNNNLLKKTKKIPKFKIIIAISKVS